MFKSGLSKFLSLLVALLTITLVNCRSIPEAKAGPDANALATQMLTAIQYDAWKNNTSAVSWTFLANHKHFWDKKRGLVQVEWDNYRVQFNKNNLKGIAFQDAKAITSKELLSSLILKAHGYFVNDAFWLNPLFHINSPGATLKRIKPGVLLVQFKSGGVTPGDTYVFYTDEKSLVTEMRLWVSIVPFKGIGATFKNYKTHTTGVRSATLYEYLLDIDISEIQMYANYPDNSKKDVFTDFPE